MYWLSIWLGFPCGSAGKESACNAGDLGSILGLGTSPGEKKGYPFQYSSLENSMDCIVHRVAKSQHDWVTFTSTFTLSIEECLFLWSFAGSQLFFEGDKPTVNWSWIVSMYFSNLLSKIFSTFGTSQKSLLLLLFCQLNGSKWHLYIVICIFQVSDNTESFPVCIRQHVFS